MDGDLVVWMTVVCQMDGIESRNPWMEWNEESITNSVYMMVYIKSGLTHA